MSRATTLAGAVLVGLALLAAGRELHQGLVHWEQLGPLPPGGPTPSFEVLTMDGGRFGPGVEALGKHFEPRTLWTQRNWNTVLKLCSMTEP